MAQPTILGEGSTPRRTDTRWRTLVKVVGAAYESLGGSASDAPKLQDTQAKLLRKLNNLLTGV